MASWSRVSQPVPGATALTVPWPEKIPLAAVSCAHAVPAASSRAVNARGRRSVRLIASSVVFPFPPLSPKHGMRKRETVALHSVLALGSTTCSARVGAARRARPAWALRRGAGRRNRPGVDLLTSGWGLRPRRASPRLQRSPRGRDPGSDGSDDRRMDQVRLQINRPRNRRRNGGQVRELPVFWLAIGPTRRRRGSARPLLETAGNLPCVSAAHRSHANRPASGGPDECR